jgi:multiple sugar transport system ATP-binding protein
VEQLGADAYLYATPAGIDASTTSDGLVPQVVARLDGRQELQAGQEVRLTADPSALHIFDTESGERLAPAG